MALFVSKMLNVNVDGWGRWHLPIVCLPVMFNDTCIMLMVRGIHLPIDGIINL